MIETGADGGIERCPVNPCLTSGNDFLEHDRTIRPELLALFRTGRGVAAARPHSSQFMKKSAVKNRRFTYLAGKIGNPRSEP